MTEIEVPDWVLEAALTAYVNAWDESVTEREKCLTDWNDDQIDHAREGVKAAITAALGAWVVPVPQFGDASSDSEWFDGELSDTSKDDPFYKTRTLYDLRQEKPE